MDVSNLIDDLRSRINPAYANMIGTESYERRLYVEAMEAQTKEIERLRADAERYRRLGWLVEADKMIVQRGFNSRDDIYLLDKAHMDRALDDPEIIKEASRIAERHSATEEE